MDPLGDNIDLLDSQSIPIIRLFMVKPRFRVDYHPIRYLTVAVELTEGNSINLLKVGNRYQRTAWSR